MCSCFNCSDSARNETGSASLFHQAAVTSTVPTTTACPCTQTCTGEITLYSPKSGVGM